MALSAALANGLSDLPPAFFLESFIELRLEYYLSIPDKASDQNGRFSRSIEQQRLVSKRQVEM
jgi:hypothetical protein